MSAALLPLPPVVPPRVLSALAMGEESDLAGRTAAGDALRLRPRVKPVSVALLSEDDGVGACAVSVDTVERKDVREGVGEDSGVVVAVPERSSGELCVPEAS